MKAIIASWLKVFQLMIALILIHGSAKSQLKADFTSSLTAGCSPIVVSFQDSSTGNPTSWKWDLGNGTTSFLQNPSATYFNPGTYTIKLIIQNAGQQDSIAKEAFITVYDNPTVNFEAPQTMGCYPLQVQFTDLSTTSIGTVAQWQWDFGNGVTSTQQNPTHTYTTQGNYNVKLKVVSSKGCFKVLEKAAFIKVEGGIKANFNYSVAGSCNPSTPVSFNNLSSGTGTLTYEWWFGDGTSSTEKNPIHIYTSTGSYSVTLITKNAQGCVDTLVKQNALNIGAVKANFNLPATICVGSNLSITNTSTPATVSSAWSFGDGTISTLNNPIKKYIVPGTYTIKLINNFGTCIDSVSKIITVLPKPTASFTATNTVACTVPSTVQFVNNTTNAITYGWNFGNTTTSNTTNPTNTYTAFGNYHISLIATAANGCTDTLTRSNFVQIAAPKINNIIRDPKEGCVPLTVNTTAAVTSIQPIASYQWSFGDSTFSAQQNPTHIYTTEGSFTILLVIKTVGGCTDSLAIKDAIKVGHKPTANFVANLREVCPTSAVQFTDLSTNGPIHKWQWLFGDGKSSTLQNPVNNYSDTGYKHVKLIVFNNGCSDTVVKGNYIFVKPPIARFNQSMNICNNKLAVSFRDSSILATSYLWNFGDGTTSTEANPIHVYPRAGTYSVYLTVTNGDCSHSRNRIITVDNQVGVLKVSKNILCKKENVTIKIDSVNKVFAATYIWNIGLGNTFTTTLPIINVRYDSVGSYPISVIINYANGCSDTLVYASTIKVFGPKAAFTVTNNQICASTNVHFTDASTTDGQNPITEFTWTYGDGSIINYTSAPFSHLYTNAGNYSVKLRVKDAIGCMDSLTVPAAVRVSKSIAKFTELDTLVCPGTPLQFTSQSSGNNLQHVWSFSNGTQSTEVNPSIIFSEGTYTVQLSVIDAVGCTDTITKLNRIKVYNPIAKFTMSDSFAVCPPLLVNMTNTSIHAGKSFWSFGDGAKAILTNAAHLYSYPKDYTVKLVVKNTGGCADSTTKQVTIKGPTGVLSYQPNLACSPVVVSFHAQTQNTIKNIWDFNDGVVSNTTTNTTTHTYTLGGHYIPKLILEDATGCRVPIIGKDTIQVKVIKAYAQVPTQSICDSANVQLLDSSISNDVITKYHWSFGNGFTSTQKNPNHNYKTNGLFSVKLKVTTQRGCTDSITYNNKIKVVSSPKANIKGDTAVCKNGTILFSSDRINPDTSNVIWNWSFGNGVTSTLQNPPAQTYTIAGSFNLVHQIINTSGCITNTVKKIIIHQLPIVNAGLDTTICRNNNYTLQANGASSYIWYGNTSTLNCTTCANPVAKPLTTITYAVIGKNAFNCVATDSITVRVQQPLKLTVASGDTLCLGETATFKATGTEKYNWYPALYVDQPNSAQVNIRPAKDTSINYMLIGKDNFNCFADTARVKVKAFPIPKMEIDQNEITVNAGATVKLKTVNSGDVTKWKWTPNRFIDNANLAEPTMIARESITYTCVASNEGNCVTRDEVKVVVVCNNGNIFVPNTFSPNGDGNNDIFYPRGKGVYTIKSLRIFNRWGEMVFEKSNFQANDMSAGWDGTYKGQKLASDAYVYSLEIMCDNSTTVPSKGSITLIR